MSERDVAGLLFTAEMYGVQLDQLAVHLAVSEVRARALAARWREQGYADSARLGPGRPWVWLTRGGLLACGRPYRPVPPALSRLAHLRAVTAVRIALESAPGYTAAGAYWRSERRLRARMGSRVPLREHLPDGEVHWPDPGGAPVGGAAVAAPAWAGECWAIEAELTRKTVRRTAAIMTEILTRTGDYGCPAAEVRVPGHPPRHARVLYVCSAAARPTVARARDTLPGTLALRVEIRGLPAGAGLAAGPPAPGQPLSPRPASPRPASSRPARTRPAAGPPRDSEAAT
ncbi:MAG: Replication-relaxation [Streptosporangiaceae bacterium]|nr:Replication-relaxation [Streptosporangiaceae bacterium]